MTTYPPKFLQNLPSNLELVPDSEVDSRTDEEIIHELTSFRPVTSDKNVWCFWDKGWDKLPKWNQRNLIGWARRWGPSGWTIHVLDYVPGSPTNVNAYVDASYFPAAFQLNQMVGEHTPQHLSDLIRLPLLYEYGGFWLDVGAYIFGDLDYIFDILKDPSNDYAIGGYALSDGSDYPVMANGLIWALKGDPFIKRWHDIYLALWEGRSSSKGMHKDPLISWMGLMPERSELFKTGREAMEASTDYVAHFRCFTRLTLLRDPSDGFNGKEYWDKKIYAFNLWDVFPFARLTGDGKLIFDLISLPYEGPITHDQQAAMQGLLKDVGSTLWAMKFPHSHGLFHHEQIADLWDLPENSEADNIEGSLAAWIRFASIHLRQIEQPKPVALSAIPEESVVVAGVTERNKDLVINWKGTTYEKSV